ncbi:hypothetical protein PVK06_019958 [Gossypium arboreum]|uniref:Uncharacterized protein n=1 Tax=Gossypium arboreum TaxID=29729 RepID=A0ABR0PL99_GOSAR|nr:hypothetical protein PVK06_019958 [Gossypium arboreum]
MQAGKTLKGPKETHEQYGVAMLTQAAIAQSNPVLGVCFFLFSREKPFEFRNCDSAVTFKENMHSNPGSVIDVAQHNFLGRKGVVADLRIDGEKVGGGHRGRKLSKTIRNRGNLFKSSTSRIPLLDSIDNLVEFITSQIEKETAQEGPKKVRK